VAQRNNKAGSDRLGTQNCRGGIPPSRRHTSKIEGTNNDEEHACASRHHNGDTTPCIRFRASTIPPKPTLNTFKMRMAHIDPRPGSEALKGAVGRRRESRLLTRCRTSSVKKRSERYLVDSVWVSFLRWVELHVHEDAICCALTPGRMNTSFVTAKNRARVVVSAPLASAASLITYSNTDSCVV